MVKVKNFFEKVKKTVDKYIRSCYNTIRKRKKGVLKMKYWKSEYTGEIYGMDDDWAPKKGCRGWTLLHDAPTAKDGKEEKEEEE